LSCDCQSCKFERIFAACAADEDCSRAYPELADGFFELIEHLDGTPAVVHVLNPVTEQSQDVVVNGSRLCMVGHRARGGEREPARHP
jgi:hypothetical protein